MQGVFIKGMPFPENCHECQVRWLEPCPLCSKPMSRKEILECMDKRHPDCPLRQIEDPMDQKIKWLSSIADNQLANAPTDTMDATSHTYYDGVWNGLQMAYEIITGKEEKENGV